MTDEIKFETNKKGGTAIIHNGFTFVKNTDGKLVSYYRCNNYKKHCKARIAYETTGVDGTFKAFLHQQHNHKSDLNLENKS